MDRTTRAAITGALALVIGLLALGGPAASEAPAPTETRAAVARAAATAEQVAEERAAAFPKPAIAARSNARQTPGGIINHVADEGYNPPIYFQCDWGYQTGLDVGSKSRWSCQNAVRFWVGDGQTLRCNYYADDRYLRTEDFSGAGWRGIASLSKFECWWRG